MSRWHCCGCQLRTGGPLGPKAVCPDRGTLTGRSRRRTSRASGAIDSGLSSATERSGISDVRQNLQKPSSCECRSWLSEEQSTGTVPSGKMNALRSTVFVDCRAAALCTKTEPSRASAQTTRNSKSLYLFVVILLSMRRS